MCGLRGALPLGKGMPGREPSEAHTSPLGYSPAGLLTTSLAQSCRLGDILHFQMVPRDTISREQYPNCSTGAPLFPVAFWPCLPPVGLPESQCARGALVAKVPGGDPGGELSYISCPQTALPRQENAYIQGATGLWEVRREAPEFSGPSVPCSGLCDGRPRAGHRAAHLKVCHHLLHLGPADVQETLNQVPVDEAGGRFCLPLRVKGPPGGGS